MRSIRLRFLALLLVAGGVACSAHQSGGMLPSSPFSMRGMKATPTPKPTPVPHAPCTIRSGFVSPLAGKLVVVTAFGQLRGNDSYRWASSGVDLANTTLQRVRAAQSGRLRYYRSFRGYSNVAVVTAKGGVQTLYAPLSFKTLPKRRDIRAGQVIGKASGKTLHFEITDGTNPTTPANEQLNPCGNADGATGTMSIVPSVDNASIANVNVSFTTFELDGVAYPTSAPGGYVTTPVTMTVAKVGPAHGWGFGTRQFGVTSGDFNFVLCGNVVFQSGEPRFSTVIPGVGGSPTVPHLVFFRDAGSVANLVEPLPGYTRGCPGTPPVSGLWYDLTMFVGQIAQGYWLTSDTTPEFMTMTSSSSTIASVSPSPSPVPILTSPPPYPPPAGTYYTINAHAAGTVVITDFNFTTMVTASPIAVTVLATPTAAPWPSPMPNSTTTPAPTSSPSPSTSP